jgi:hypothetical protein
LDELAWGESEEGFHAKPRTALGRMGGGFRNQLFDVLESIFGPVLIDTFEPTPDFLTRCYATSEDASRYRSRLSSILVDPIPSFRNPIQLVKPGAKKDPFDANFRAQVDSRKQTPLVVLMGGPGVGKTTFLEWYFKTQRPDTESDFLLVKLDFRHIECTPAEVHATTLKNLVEVLGGCPILR